MDTTIGRERLLATCGKGPFLWEPTKLSVIIPFRDEGAAPWFMERLTQLCAILPKHPDLEFLVVDSGSKSDAREAAEAACARNSIRYLYHDSATAPFAIGKARDFGACHARGRAIMFFDVDCRVPDDFWPRLLAFMSAFGTSVAKKRFFTIPVIYLTQDGTAAFQSADPATRFLAAQLQWLNGDTSAIQNIAPCTSLAVIDRLHYLSIGGHRPEFRGHGYEDLELYHRLLAEDGSLPRSRDYYVDTKTWDTATYRGFRSMFSLIGRPALLANLVAVHLWHPRPQTVSFYNPKMIRRAREIWLDLFKNFDRNGEHPEPLIGASAQQRRALIFGEPRTNSARCLRDAIPLIGEPVYVSEHDYFDADLGFMADDLESTIEHHGISTIIFSNPYGNPARLAAYHWCRANDFPFLCFERGALPDSWFFDAKGCNADSASYDRGLWDRPLTNKEHYTTLDYINACILGTNTLEKQGERIGRDALASRLKVGGKKILFVPLQRPSDTVTVHMAGAIGSCHNFITLIDQVAKELNRYGYLVLCKKHPLETETPPLVHARYIPADTNFLDLLELADAVALMNSGIGVYAMMMGKPCFIFGQAFYAFDGINVTVASNDPEDIGRQIRSSYQVDKEATLRFIRYLTEEFYSFGHNLTKTVEANDGSLRTTTTNIDFYKLRIPECPHYCYETSSSAPIAHWAPLFERYKLDLVQQAKRSAPATSPKAAATAIAPRPQRSGSGKWRKLRRDPHAFFRDAHFAPLRPLRFAFRPAR